MNIKEPSKTYHKIKDIIFYVGIFLDLTILIVFFISGLSVSLRDFSSSISSNFFILNGIYIAIFFWAVYLIHLPLSFLDGFYWEHKFDLSNQTFSEWFGDSLKKAALSFVIFLMLIEVIYLLLSKFPENWWVGAGFFWLFLTVVLARLTPQFIIPLFFKYADIDNQELKRSIVDLFNKCKVKLHDVYSIDFSKKTNKANAFVCGIGKHRRVILSDTLISNFTVPEIETVVAHELGHYKHQDILKFTVINSLVVFAGFYIVDKAIRMMGIIVVDDIANLPILALFFAIFAFLTTPILNGYSRALEVRADQFSLELTQKPGDFISMMQKLGDMNLAEFKPNKFKEIMFYDHPSVQQRIDMAEEFKPAHK